MLDRPAEVGMGFRHRPGDDRRLEQYFVATLARYGKDCT
jgi:hypothetical protein